MTASIKWAAQLRHVVEVSLEGEADGAYWRDRLRSEGLTPAIHEGRAKLLVVGAEGRFMGFTFREVSVSVTLAPETGYENLFYLVRAFNSNSFFAFCERFLFATPYDAAEVAVTQQPVALQVCQRGQPLFEVRQSASSVAGRALRVEGEEQATAHVVLPRPATKSTGEAKMFVAKLSGLTRRYPFVAGEDVFTLCPQAAGDVLEQLRDSHFTPREWVIRPDAAHAKSVTYTRAKCPRLPLS